MAPQRRSASGDSPSVRLASSCWPSSAFSAATETNSGGPQLVRALNVISVLDALVLLGSLGRRLLLHNLLLRSLLCHGFLGRRSLLRYRLLHSHGLLRRRLLGHDLLRRSLHDSFFRDRFLRGSLLGGSRLDPSGSLL